MNYKHKIVIAAIMPVILVLLVVIPNNAEALEFNSEFFIDSQNAFVIIGIDSIGKTTILEGGVVVNGEWEYWTTETLKVSRIIDNGETGRFFGKTDAGNSVYTIYDVNGENAEILVKVWHDGIKTRILENAVVYNIF